MAVDAPPEVRIRRFTADEFLRMCEVGIIGADERAELIDGEITVVSPPSPDHAHVIDELNRRLTFAYGEEFTVRVQQSIGGLEYQQPEPDVAVRPTTGPWTVERRHLRFDESLLVVEVSVTSQRADRRKVRVYASGGAPVYWLVDVPARTVAVHAGARADGTWEQVTVVAQDGEPSLPGLGARLRVADILPPGRDPP